MRIVDKQEFLTLPAGTLFARLQTPWVFDGVEIKNESRGDDYYYRQLAWVDADDSHEAIDKLEKQYKDSSVSYPCEEGYDRAGSDEEGYYMVFEQADIESIIEELRGAYEL